MACHSPQHVMNDPGDSSAFFVLNIAIHYTLLDTGYWQSTYSVRT